jgi:hypothetical protein
MSIFVFEWMANISVKINGCTFGVLLSRVNCWPCMIGIFCHANFFVLRGFNFINLKAVKEKVKEREDSTERPGQTECKVLIIVVMVFDKQICKIWF